LPATRVNELAYPLSKRTALWTIASNTGWISVCERLITRRMSPVAVCVSSAEVSSRLLACSSVNIRTFSIAITAWSAKVFSSSIWRSENGRTSNRNSTIAPRAAAPFRTNGVASIVRWPNTRWSERPSGSSASGTAARSAM